MPDPAQRILITGPESTGKSTLARQVGDVLRIPVVPEFARRWLEKYGPQYTYGDLSEIARGQFSLEDDRALATDRLVCDTGPLVLKIWAEYRFGRCPDLIETAFRERLYDPILLCSPDIDWQPDPLRENPGDRRELFALYRQTLLQYGKSFAVISGSGSSRLQRALEVIRDDSGR